MIQMLFSEWIFRFFLIYLVVVGAAVLIWRPSPIQASPRDILTRLEIRRHWAGRWTWCAVPRAKWWDKLGIRIGLTDRSNSLFRREP